MPSDQKKFSKLSRAVYEKDAKEVEKLLSSVKADAFPGNAYGDSLLMMAIDNGAKLDLIKLLVEKGEASLAFKSSRNETPLTFALQHDRADVLAYFKSRGADVKIVPFEELPQEEKDARMFRTVDDWTDDKLPARLKGMLAGGANANAKRDGRTPIFRLLDQGASVPKAFSVLIEGGADPKAQDDRGNTALHAISEQSSDIASAKLFIERGVDINTKNKAGQTPLHVAAQAGYWDAAKFVKMLLDKGADPSAKDTQGKTPTHFAQGDTKKLLLSKTSVKLSADEVALIKAVASKKSAAVRELCDKGVSPCVLDTSSKKWGDKEDEGVSALHLAFSRGADREIAEYLLTRKNLDPSVPDISSKTPLHYVLDRMEGSDRAALVQKLLDVGADPNAADDFGRTPMYELLSFYKYGGECELIDKLVAAGAKLDHQDNAGETILDAAYQSVQYFHEKNDKVGFCKVMDHLLEHGATGENAQQARKWLETKGAKYLGKKVEEKPKGGVRPRVTFEAIAKKTLRDQTQEDAWVDIEGEHEPVALFDWFAFLDEEEQDESDNANQISEYHIDADIAEEHVQKLEWIPFAVVGMTGANDSYEEISTHGTLFCDLRRAKKDDCPVVFVPNSGTIHRLTEEDEPRDLPLSFQALMTTLTDKRKKKK